VKVNAIISAALNLAVRYEWIDRNPAERATLPRLAKREPDPPSPRDAARLLNEVFVKDEEFGLFLWAAMTTGARRGELLALREDRFDSDDEALRCFRFMNHGQLCDCARCLLKIISLLVATPPHRAVTDLANCRLSADLSPSTPRRIRLHTSAPRRSRRVRVGAKVLTG
jgi:hypothetical protein